MTEATATTTVNEVHDLRRQVRVMEATLRLFADPFNWQRDTQWNPVTCTVEQNYPSELASKALEACGL